MENKILKKANELLKKEIATDFKNLSNKEKIIVVSALKKEYKLKELLLSLSLNKATYFYEIKHINDDKYKNIRIAIKSIFNSNYNCYGYRRIKIALNNEYNINISEKVIIRLMKEEKLFVYIPKSKKKYSSYEGEITPEVPNIINRDFKATKPFEKALTDISEFPMYDGKVYLSPLIDYYDELPITWTIGKSPNTTLTNTMLDKCIYNNFSYSINWYFWYFNSRGALAIKFNSPVHMLINIYCCNINQIINIIMNPVNI